MRAWRFHEFGDISNLRLETAPMPVAGPGEVLLRMQHAAINPADRYMVAGQYPRPAPRPFSVGRDGCGLIHQALPDGRFAEGDAVVVLSSDLGVGRDGTLAEFVAVPEDCLAPLPDGWSSEEGAAAPLVFLTAWQALFDQGALQPGGTVLITGASGGVGTAALLLAKAHGARTVVLSRNAEKRAALSVLGADIVLDSDRSGLVERVKSALGNGRVDVVVDLLGGDYLDLSTQLVRYEGRIIVVGLLAGLEARVSLGRLIHKCLTIRGISVNAYGTLAAREAWASVVEMLDGVGQRPLVDACYAIDEVQRAFTHLASGPLGKICIKLE